MERFGLETKECMSNELKTLFEKNTNVFVSNGIAKAESLLERHLFEVYGGEEFHSPPDT